ncbi:hypothetical protein OPV22_014287 [Ensete ventricosum]|uniref:SMP-LTD domain-containing protein n=1 Tax=Ensete ventricosum TaxID=4639 RepID=A0AAV8R6T1_ENSVE|nr:hypothetical protein OPV22_014287 [Ensete ventricosum]
MRKPLSSIANDLLDRCAETLDTSVDSLIEEFEQGLKPAVDNYSRRLVEFCCSKTIKNISPRVGKRISDGSISRFTYDMMLAWQNPSTAGSEPSPERFAKEKEDKSIPLEGNEGQMHDDIPLFYSDIMPLLVNEESSVGEDAFVWFASLIPLVADVVNARFSFETLTAPTASQLHFPAYDRFLKEIDKCVKYLQKQETPTGVELSENEFILHVEGTSKTHRVVRHIGATSWPGRLSLTNQALYFEASGVVSYETALKIDLSRADVGHQVKETSTGPWGFPLFDKAIAYESSELSERLVLEFPEMTSSTRRDHWLTLIKEVILLHHFTSKFNIEHPVHVWEIHARTILGVLRLHAARELLRISPPAPANFLIFSLYEDLPKGDYVLAELANAVKQATGLSPCTATSILKGLNISHGVSLLNTSEDETSSPADTLKSLETTIDQVREEVKEVSVAKATVEEMKEEGISDSLLTLVELASSMKIVLPWFQVVVSGEKPTITFFMIGLVLVVIYREWVGFAIAVVLMLVVGTMLWARRNRIGERHKEIVVSTTSDKTTMESIVAAQHSLKNLHEIVKTTNITILRIWSILIGKSPKQANVVMWAMIGIAVLLVAVPFKYILMWLLLCFFIADSKIAKRMSSEQGNRRLREWWESIPIIPVRTISSRP